MCFGAGGIREHTDLSIFFGPPRPSGGNYAIGITRTAGAIANAVWHATGLRVRRLPIALEEIIGAAEA
jgi:CO/xanthine dehydrogenase Mo-binding subunit